MVSRFDIYLVNLDAEPSKNPKNTRPCVVISPDEMNRNIASVIIAPLTASPAKYPTRVPVNFLNTERLVVLDQMRAVDKARLVKSVGKVEMSERKAVLERLAELFAE